MIFFIKYFVYFFLQVHWNWCTYICLLMCLIHMVSLMYMIFSKKQRITFFYPQDRWVGWKICFSLWSIFVLQVTGAPVPRLCVTEPVFATTPFLEFFFWIAWRILDVIGTSLYCPPQIKCILIFQQEFSSFEKAPQLWDTEVFMNFTKETNIKVCYTDVVQQYKAYGMF